VFTQPVIWYRLDSGFAHVKYAQRAKRTIEATIWHTAMRNANGEVPASEESTPTALLYRADIRFAKQPGSFHF
jgi:hypothetical protein